MIRIILIIIPLGILFSYSSVLAPTSPHRAEKRERESSTRITTVLAVGDIMLGRHVGTQIERAANPDLPFDSTRVLINSADIAFGNLECPLSDSGIAIREGLVFRCLTRHIDGVANAGFDVLSTANNHAFDQGRDNIDFTIDYLRSKNILPVGTTLSSSQEKGWGEVVERNGIHFGFLGYSYSARNDGRTTVDSQIATMDIPQMQKGVGKLKSRADIIIVSMHAGAEYTRHPTAAQIDFAHAAIDAGADIVLGHHPHWIQDIEAYSPAELFPPLEGEGEGGVKKTHKGLIFYSLGNFVFDQMWSQDTREGLMVRLNFSGKELDSYELLPIIIDNYCCPHLADEKEKTEILQKIDSQPTITLTDN